MLWVFYKWIKILIPTTNETLHATKIKFTTYILAKKTTKIWYYWLREFAGKLNSRINTFIVLYHHQCVASADDNDGIWLFIWLFIIIFFIQKVKWRGDRVQFFFLSLFCLDVIFFRFDCRCYIVVKLTINVQNYFHLFILIEPKLNQQMKLICTKEKNDDNLNRIILVMLPLHYKWKRLLQLIFSFFFLLICWQIN